MILCMLNKPISESICLVLTSYECPNSFNQTASVIRTSHPRDQGSPFNAIEIESFMWRVESLKVEIGLVFREHSWVKP